MLKKKLVRLSAGLLFASLFSLSVDHKVEAAAYQLTNVSGPKTVAPGGKFQIKLTGHLPGGQNVQITPSANGYTFDTSAVLYPELNYIHVDKEGVVTVSPNSKGALREAIMIHLPGGSLSSFSFTVERPSQFSDTAGSFAKDAIYRLVQNQAVSGVGDGTFQPHRVITHEEFATMLERVNHDLERPIVLPIQATGWPDYQDNQNHQAWYYPYVQNNICIPPMVSSTVGRSEEVFGVGKPISRQDAVDAIMRTFLQSEVYWLMHDMDPKRKINWDSFQPFKDVGTNASYYDEITAAKFLGITSGYSDGKFHPNDSITREMAVQLIDQAVQKLVATKQQDGQMIYGYQPFLIHP